MTDNIPTGPDLPGGDDTAWEAIVAGLRHDADAKRWSALSDTSQGTSAQGPVDDDDLSEEGFAEGRTANVDPGDEVGPGNDGDANDGDTGNEASSRDDADDEGRAGPAAVIPPGPIVIWRGPTAGDEAIDPPDDDFHAPVPPPLPRTDAFTTAAWAAAVGGPLYLMLSAIVGLSGPRWAAFLAVGAFFLGAGVLVARMGSEPPEDDGAVV